MRNGKRLKFYERKPGSEYGAGLYSNVDLGSLAAQNLTRSLPEDWFSIGVKFEDENTALSFFTFKSKENGDLQPPRLVVTYYTID